MTTANFVFDKETPGTWKFKEQPPKGQPPMSGSLYLKKHVVEQLGEPEVLTVTVEPA
jgi:hypothetical protein